VSNPDETVAAIKAYLAGRRGVASRR
jgi:hypothetical protein